MMNLLAPESSSYSTDSCKTFRLCSALLRLFGVTSPPTHNPIEILISPNFLLLSLLIFSHAQISEAAR